MMKGHWCASGLAMFVLGLGSASASQVFYEELALEEMLGRASLIVVASPAEPRLTTQKLRLEKSRNSLRAVLPNGKKVAEIEKLKGADWSKADYVPSHTRYQYVVQKVVHGALPKERKKLCVVSATWTYDIHASLEYDYNQMGESPIHEAYQSKTQRKVTQKDPRILFLFRDSIDEACYREVVTSSYEATSELARVRAILKKGK